MLTQPDMQQPTALEKATHSSIWIPVADDITFQMLDCDLSVEVVIIGGGITGLSTAAALVNAGRSVVLLEAARVGCGSTGHSSGTLCATVEPSLHLLREKWGEKTIATVVHSRQQAIDQVEKNVARYRLQCDFKRQPWALYSIDGSAHERDAIESEYHAALATGLDARLALDLPLPYMTRKAMVIPQQAQFNPTQYVRQLAAALDSPQCRIFEMSAVTHIDEQHGMVSTSSYNVRADHIVIATHTPKGVSLLHTELSVYREYAVAAELTLPTLDVGIFQQAGFDPTLIRTAMINAKPHVLLMGQKHRASPQQDGDHPYQRLSECLAKRFQLAADYRWSAQYYCAADGLPFIGSSSSSSNVYLATGLGSNGLAYGVLAGEMIADEIAGIQNTFAELYSPRRFTPVKSAINFVRENFNVAGCYIKDYAQAAGQNDVRELKCDQGKLIEIGGEKLAAYRDNGGKLHLVSAVCTHLKCIVRWNHAEHSWDCPCHGSRFDIDGSVIEGPALKPLSQRSELDN